MVLDSSPAAGWAWQAAALNRFLLHTSFRFLARSFMDQERKAINAYKMLLSGAAAGPFIFRRAAASSDLGSKATWGIQQLCKVMVTCKVD